MILLALMQTLVVLNLEFDFGGRISVLEEPAPWLLLYLSIHNH